jgi:hypothetical protein
MRETGGENREGEEKGEELLVTGIISGSLSLTPWIH